MRKIYYFLAGIILTISGCNDRWADYYAETSNIEENMNITVAEYLAQHSEYSAFYDMLKKTGLDTELTKDQQISVWVVNNEGMGASEVESGDTLRMKYHLNHLPFLRTDLKAGLRIRSLNGIYFQIASKDNKLYANASEIKKSIRLKDGVVHEISTLMKSRINIYQYLKELDDDYSIIRDSIFKYSIEKFDRAKSTPIGVDKTGNTLYDSIFYIYNPMFETVEFSSEFKQFTVFLPSNDVIRSCFETLSSTYSKMGKTVERSDSLLALKWIKEAMFYNGELGSENFNVKDINSAFGRVWRTAIQELDLENPEPMSNGVVYRSKKIKIPNNVIISRIKSLVEYWQYQEKVYPDPEDLYIFKGLKGNPSAYVADATPKPAVLPNYIVLNVPGDVDSQDEFSVEFPPLERYVNPEDGKFRVRVMEVPTGEYNLYMGFWSSNHPNVNIYFNGEMIGRDITASLSTPWNYDRVTETERDLDPVNGVNRWNGLGGLVGVVKIDGEGMASFKIKVEFSKVMAVGSKKSMAIYHWSLKPTSNNY